MSTRRQFLTRAGSAGAAIILTPQAGALARPAHAKTLLRGGRFSQGLQSGDPTPNGITLSTIVDDVEGSGGVRLEVARDSGFRHLVASKVISTDKAHHHAVKARVTGLKAGEGYYYRFETRGRESPAGRFKTAVPADSREPVRFVFYSCADYTHGFYNAYDVMAREDDIDFVVCLGDYIYAEAEHTKASGTAVREDPIGLAESLADYRAKYALYRSDPALRKMHARFPVVAVWDDHEVRNDYAGSLPNGGLPPAAHYSVALRNAAYKAYFEAMPFVPSGRSRIYRSLRFGRHAELILLDERQYRADQPCGDTVGPDCAERHAGPRSFLGARQLAFLKARLSGSSASWKLIGNPTLMMPTKASPTVYSPMDAWQGYIAEREDVVAHVAKVSNVAFLTGDFHTFLSGDVRPGESADPASAVAPEFHSGSITSQSLGEGEAAVIPGANDQNPNTPPALIDVLKTFNPWVHDADLDHHGYGIAEASANELRITYRRVRTIKQRSRDRLPDLSWTVAKGQRSLFT
jgi:alkaline phosphatase D